jgi:methylthioribose-1-phosphate isomerase
MTNKTALPTLNGAFAPVGYRDGGIDMLDQTVLPHRTVMLRLTTVPEVAEAIRVMNVRGAPAIGVTAAYGMVLEVESHGETVSAERLRAAAETLRAARPTAVNLAWAIDRMLAVFDGVRSRPAAVIRETMREEALRIHTEDVDANRRIGAHGAALLPDGARVLTICNTGALATGGYGTAYGILHAAHDAGKLAFVYACETRPRLQGARLTAWELVQDGIPFKLLSDGAAPYLMARGAIDAVLAGADRIARNGDTANKIGTYALAVSAAHHGIPLYVVAPTSTIDPATTTGAGIPIEERSEDEVLAPLGTRFAPEGASAWNPAFDVTPAALIAGIVTENGVSRPPFEFSES